MSDRGWLSSREALGIACGGLLALVGGCAYVYNFDEYKLEETHGSGGGSGTASGSGGSGPQSSSSSSGMAQGGGGSSGSGCTPEAECGIEEMAEGEGAATYGDLALGVDNVYWIEGQGVLRTPKNAAEETNPQIVLGSIVAVRLLAVNSDIELYVATEGDGILVCPALSGTPQTSISTDKKATALAFNDKFLYWSSTTDNMIHSNDPAHTPEPAGASPSEIVAYTTPGAVYWSYQGEGGGSGGVDKLGPTEIASQQSKPSGLAADATHVYWITSDGAVHRATSDGDIEPDSSPAVDGAMLLSGRVAVSGGYVYWTGPDTYTCQPPCDCGMNCGAIWAAPKDDLSKAGVFARGSWESVQGLAADGEHVFWTTKESSSAHLLRKSVK